MRGFLRTRAFKLVPEKPSLGMAFLVSKPVNWFKLHFTPYFIDIIIKFIIVDRMENFTVCTLNGLRIATGNLIEQGDCQ